MSKQCNAAATPELRVACIAAAREAIARHGIESLHQAPYKHYPSRDHLLAEVMRRCFQQFAQHLDARRHFDDPHQDLESLAHNLMRRAASGHLLIGWGTGASEMIATPGERTRMPADRSNPPVRRALCSIRRIYESIPPCNRPICPGNERVQLNATGQVRVAAEGRGAMASRCR